MNNIAILSIHRGDRPRFLHNLNRMIEKQTLQPSCVHFVDYPPNDDLCDISKRYRNGYEYLSSLPNIELIIIMEVDDYYSPNYIETVYNQWLLNNKPDIIGQSYTIYYNIRMFSYFMFNHLERSSMMNTAIKSRLKIAWPVDTEPYTDTHLWMTQKHLSKVIFKPEAITCIGIKHGVGMTGGSFHTTKLHRYQSIHKGVVDLNKEFLKRNMDEESFKFYSEYFN